MKKLLLSVFALTALSASVNAQIIVRGIAPTAIEGNKPFEWANPTETQNGWISVPDFNIAGTYVQDTIQIAEDGTVGMSTDVIPHPLSQEGCNPYTNAAAVAGKIAVVYRGTCAFSMKATNAESAGAVGLVIINRDPDPVGMGGGLVTNTIPVVMIGSGPGVDITTAALTDDVIMFLGNKIGILANDITVQEEFAKVPFSAGNSSLLAADAFDPALRVFNFGSAAQSGVEMNLKIVGPGVGGATVYDNSISGISIPVGDSAEALAGTANVFPTLDLSTLANGEYFLTYSAFGTANEQDSSDNTYTSSFSMTSNFVSASRLDANNDPVHDLYPASATSTGAFQSCMTYTNSDLSSVMITGIKFVPSADSTYDLTQEEIGISISRWSGPNDLNTVQSPAEFETFYFLPDNTVNKQTVFVPFENPFVLANDTTYLVCLSSQEHADVQFGYDTGIDYNGNESYDILLQSPMNIGGTWFSGWAGNYAPSIALEVKPASLSINKTELIDASAYPNPVNGDLTIRANTTGNATVVLTDMSGKIVSTNNVSFVNGATTVDMANLEAGIYMVNISAANGATSKLKVIKK